MRGNSLDAFKNYDLPFSSYFNACMSHEEESHDEIEFIWLFQGDLQIECEGKIYHLASDDVFIIYMNQKHSIKSSAHSLSVTFRLKKDYLLSHRLFFELTPYKNRVFTIAELTQKYHQIPLIMSQLILLMQSTKFTLNTRYRLIGYYNMYVFDLYSSRLKDKYLDVKKKNYDPYLIRFYTINAYINDHYAEKITLDTLANLVSISPHRLSHFIKEVLGISFQEYLQNIRFEKALFELTYSDTPIKDIVSQCGFSDQKYFNAELKKRFSLTALKYRKMMKNDVPNDLEVSYDAHMLQEFKEKLNHMMDHTQIVFGPMGNP